MSTNTSSTPRETIRVAVLCTDANGAPDFFFCAVPADRCNVDEGEHYDQAKALCAAEGFGPLHAFDEKDPAWKAITRDHPYKEFYADAVSTLQDCLVDGREPSGADIISEVSELFQRAELTPVFIAVSADGFWNNTDGWVESATQAHLAGTAQDFDGLIGTNVTVVQLDLKDVISEALLDRIPDVETLHVAAENAIERSRKYGFTISQDNAVEVLTEELQMDGCDMDVVAKLGQVLHSVMLNTLATAQESRSPRER